MLKWHISKSGYFYVSLSSKGNTMRAYVHRLIATVFVGRPSGHPERDCVNHINGIKTDNRPENLEWVTKGENNRHAFKTGLVVGPKRKFSSEQVKYIRSSKKSCSQLSRELGADIKTIWNIRVRKTYKEVV